MRRWECLVGGRTGTDGRCNCAWALMGALNLMPRRACRDLPYGFDFLTENVIDPAHVSFSHHGILVRL